MIRSVPTPPVTPPYSPLRPPLPRARHRGRRLVILGTGAGLLVLAAASSAYTSHAFDQALSRMDEQAVKRAAATFDRTIEQQRGQALAQVRLLVDDNRVRSTVITPRFDEATVRDVLDDLRRASGAAVLAVLDVNGKVSAVSGLEGLKKESLGQTAAVKRALERPTADVWSFPERILVIAVAPVLSGNQVAALLMVGFELGGPALAGVEQALGVSGALVVADRVMARGSADGAATAGFEAARAVPEGTTALVGAWLARAARTSESAAGARALWLVPRHQQAGLFGPVASALWMPALAMAVMLLFSIVWTRR
jgi:hypothetical protein